MPNHHNSVQSTISVASQYWDASLPFTLHHQARDCLTHSRGSSSPPRNELPFRLGSMLLHLTFMLCLACSEPSHIAGYVPRQMWAPPALAPTDTLPFQPSADRLCATLRECALSAGILIGAAVQSRFFGDSLYITTLSREFNSVTPEGSLKFDALAPQSATYNFQGADPIIEFAALYGQQVRGHSFVWHEALPAWFSSKKWNREQAVSLLQSLISTTMGRYKGKVARWDVVNEAFENSGSLRNTPWRHAIGDDYIELAFKLARAADPNVLLFYNDHGIEFDGVKTDSVFAYIQRLRRKGVPIDGVGIEMHVSVEQAPQRDVLVNVMNRFASLGIAVEITEMDVRIPDAVSTDFLARQAKVYADAVAACVSVPACRGVTFWGFTDRYSWIPRYRPGWGSALPFDSSYQPKLAYTAILNALRGIEGNLTVRDGVAPPLP